MHVDDRDRDDASFDYDYGDRRGDSGMQMLFEPCVERLCFLIIGFIGETGTVSD